MTRGAELKRLAGEYETSRVDENKLEERPTTSESKLIAKPRKSLSAPGTSPKRKTAQSSREEVAASGSRRKASESQTRTASRRGPVFSQTPQKPVENRARTSKRKHGQPSATDSGEDIQQADEEDEKQPAKRTRQAATIPSSRNRRSQVEPSTHNTRSKASLTNESITPIPHTTRTSPVKTRSTRRGGETLASVSSPSRATRSHGAGAGDVSMDVDEPTSTPRTLRSHVAIPPPVRVTRAREARRRTLGAELDSHGVNDADVPVPVPDKEEEAGAKRGEEEEEDLRTSRKTKKGKLRVSSTPEPEHIGNSLDLENWDFDASALETADDDWQTFYRDAVDTSNSLDGLFSFPTNKGEQFQPRACFKDLYKQVWKQSMEEGKHVIITGQPGIGKTVSLWYLMRAALRHTQTQPIVYVAGELTHIFFNNKVYTANTTMDLPKFPYPKQSDTHVRLLVFLDFEASQALPVYLYKEHRILIQACSLSLIRKCPTWIKQVNYKIVRITLPRWTRKELIDNFRTANIRNDEFLKSIKDGIDVQCKDYTGVQFATYSLNQQIRKALSESLFDKNYPGVWEAVQKHPSCPLEQMDDECIVSVLIDDAIYHVGLAPQDVYAFVVERSDTAIKAALRECNLEHMASGLVYLPLSLDENSQQLLAIHNGDDEVHDKVKVRPKTWYGAFKSNHIAQLVKERYGAQIDLNFSVTH
ncbi:hypothetical protein E1B28_003410 [Marasmius oreades]|uniref:Uncharacterized protein n=1 Tax=Marasmius oreades TaxID=181124 RepID=A0A9P7UJT9_9AGAR|nr:uncharacterized protein E1B28_003410 [Marasmius oreades]KAG7085877.1 hypothetical protein E1B28_003410 [Marasmius oreades]